ncbi:response regulator [Nocardioides sp. R-C-SC26]|uniref:response regulator n=1 Tax=Nocardioides sp. R-C-SC26 TaxID=2870414 RepID=UPI001E35B504|nr:response regulator [Nocardioides sp. R-C-SC26]
MTTIDPAGMAARIVDATPDGLWVMDLDGNTLYANERLAEILRRPLDEIYAMNGALVADEQGASDFAEHLALMRGGHPGGHNDDVLVVLPNGERVWTLCSWLPLRDEDDHVLGYLHRLTEHTERRALHEALRDREHQLIQAQTIAHIGSWWWEVGNDVVWWSDELYRIYGLSAGEFEPTYEGFLACVHPDDRALVHASVEQAFIEGPDLAWEARIVRPNGDVRWVRGLGLVECDESGAPARISGTAQDITDTRLAADAADAANRRLSLLQQLADDANRSESISDAIMRSAASFTASGEWLPLAVWVRQSDDSLTPLAMPEPAARVMPTPHRGAAESAWRSREPRIDDAEDLPGTMIATLPVRNDTGTVCVIQAFAPRRPLTEAEWSLIRQVGAHLGRVAERDRARTQLAEARDEAMAASQHKSEFLATMSHEIRTPLNGVIGLTDLLLRTGLDERQQRLGTELRAAGLMLLGLINDILDLSKIESGRLDLEATTFDLRSVLDDTITVIAGTAAEKGIELVIDCDESVPPAVVGDPVRVAQVLTNLASNAVKFTDVGEVVIVLSVDARSTTAAAASDELASDPEDDATKPWIVVRGEVRDTGVGIAADQVERLFDAFTQADRSTTREHGGTGLGLAISRRLVEAMDGEIGVRTAPGAGSAFWFTVRLGVPSSDAAAAVASRSTRGRLDTRRVLVVDDNATAAGYLARQLTGWSLTVDTASSGAAALLAIAAGIAAGTPYDVAIIDRDLPDIDGLRLAAQVRALPGADGLDLLLLADTAVIAPSESRQATFRAQLSKPVRPSALYDALARREPSARPGAGDRSVRALPTALGLDVLIVEDNPVNQMVATGLLETMGCRVGIAADGMEAVEALAGGHGYDLVLMDCRMPRLDGYDATRAIRAQEDSGRVPIIAMTASALPGERDRCLAAGMDDFLTKPVEPAALAQVLKRWGAGRPIDDGWVPVVDPTAGPIEAEIAVPVLDDERIEMLSELVKDGVNFFERTRMSFLSRVDSSLARLSISIADGDLEHARTHAHALKGSCTNIGLMRAGGAAAAIETAAEEGRGAELATLLDLLRAEMDAGVRALASVVRPT